MLKQLQEEEVEFEVDPENWTSVAMFTRCATQWRMGFGGATGLDYTAVDTVLRIFKIEDVPAVFSDIQVMEASALSVMNKS